MTTTSCLYTNVETFIWLIYNICHNLEKNAYSHLINIPSKFVFGKHFVKVVQVYKDPKNQISAFGEEDCQNLSLKLSIKCEI